MEILRRIWQFLFRPIKLPGLGVILLGAIQYVPDWKARWDFWSGVFVSKSGLPDVTATVLTSPYLGFALVVIGLTYLYFVRGVVHVHHLPLQAETRPQASLSMVVHRAEPAPDWPIRSLVFHIKPDILVTTGQRYFDAVFDEIVDKFSTGQLKCWGRRINYSDRLPLGLIDPNDWQHLKLISWLMDNDGGNVLQADRRKHNSPVSQYTDLQVNRAQAIGIWPPKPIARDVKLKEALTYAATGKWGLEPMNDDGTSGSISQIGKELERFMQSARDGTLKVWGKANSWGVYDPISSEYWSTHRVDFLSLFRDEASIESDNSPLPHYQDLMVSRTEFNREWPHVSTP